jgi:hypothetical protein
MPIVFPLIKNGRKIPTRTLKLEFNGKGQFLKNAWSCDEKNYGSDILIGKVRME